MKAKTIILAVLAMAAGAVGSASAQTADELLEQGREAYLDYKFDEAARLYAQAKKKVRKADADFTTRYDRYRHQLTNAENFLNRVEKIVIIDSITVPRKDFFKSYRLPASAGSLRGADAIPSRQKLSDYVFTNEGEDYKLWAQPDSTGFYRLVESNLLTDGNWSSPTSLSDDLAEDCDAIYPFMMADGVTLYYADNGDNSIGGYDIMVATRDATDGTFLQPQNLGFPYNSPYDDYLLAIDELNGVGWWATDRNQLDDELTIYVFLTNDLRTNYDPDEDNLAGYARIDDYIATQPEDGDYDELLTTLRNIDPNVRTKKTDFHLPASGGRVYTTYDQLPGAEARAAVKRLLADQAVMNKAEAELSATCREYARTHASTLASRIKRMEADIETTRAKVAKSRNDVYRLLAK